jgi:hypothetical protein
VAAALLGTQRRQVRPLPGALTPESAPESAPESGPEATGDPAGRLLAQAALLTVRRRAGWRPGRAEPVAPAPAETAPVVPPDAARRVERMLAGDHTRVLPEWLAAVARAGYRVPAGTLPDLLERGRIDRPLRPYIAKTAGRRAMWLALRNPDWAYLVAEPAAAPEPPAADPGVWDTGARGQRLAYLERLRAADPDAARAALRGTWATEPAQDRAAFLATFQRGLGPADEEFLEQARADRAKDVRQVAAGLLARLPGSAYARRQAEHARGCLRPARNEARGREQLWITVAPPAGGPAALRELLAVTPPATWTDLFERSPLEVVGLPIADEHARDVHVGWARAAVLHRDAEWARALLDEERALLNEGVVPAELEVVADLLGVLPAAERDAAGAELLRRAGGHGDLLRILDRIRGPWAGDLADAVLGAMTDAAGRLDGARFLGQLCRLADERLHPDTAPRVAEVARQYDTWPLTELAETLCFRHDMLKELA